MLRILTTKARPDQASALHSLVPADHTGKITLEEGTEMSTTSRLSVLLSLCAVFTLPGCQMTAPTTRQPAAPVAKQSTAPTAQQPPSIERAPAAGGGPNLALSSARGESGSTVTVTATLTTGGASIAGTQNDIVYDPKQIAVAQTSAGKPDCRANPQLGKEGTAFNFLPPGCHGAACTSVRALVLSLSNVDPIANGSTLYTCRVQILAGAHPGIARLGLSRVGFSNPTGQSISGGGTDGAVNIEPKG